MANPQHFSIAAIGLAESTLLPVLGDLAGLTSVTALAVVAALKGKPVVVLAGLALTPLVWIVGSVRLAKPNSYWARRFYTDTKLARARGRFPNAEAGRDYSVASGALVSLAFVLLLAFVAWQVLGSL